MTQPPTVHLYLDLPTKPGPTQPYYLHPAADLDHRFNTQSSDSSYANLDENDGRSLRLDAKSCVKHATAVPSPYFHAKKVIEFIVTIGLMVVAIPLMSVIAALILVSQGRPIFYHQTRVGKDGKPFRIWKFRSMRNDAEKQMGAVWSDDNDPRVTSLGKWLRCSHLDELPQLINILAGDMSLIGPRPERPEFIVELSCELPSYLERLRVRPGITGLAQLGLGYDHCVSDVRGKVELDIHYINTASLLSDCRLFLLTFPYIFRTLAKKWNDELRASEPNSECTLTSCKTLSQTKASNRVNPKLLKPPRSLAG